MSGPAHRFMPVPSNDNLLSIPQLVQRQGSGISLPTTNYDEQGYFGLLFNNFISFKSLHNRLQGEIYNFLERPYGAYCFMYHFTVFFIVISCLVYSSILTVYIEKSYSTLFWTEFVLFILFLIEYILRVWSAGSRNKYRGPRGRLLFICKVMCIVDLCVIIGYAIILFVGLSNLQLGTELIRYARILQILRFLHIDRRLTSWRLLGSVVYDHRHELIATLYFCFMFLIVVAYLIWLVERDESKPPSEDMFHSFADTLWWAIVTMTTIGYGDKCPRTHIGKMITSCLCICGVAFWTLPSGIIGSGFALKVEQKKREKQFNRLVPAAATLIQHWWRLVALRRPCIAATWCIYRIESKRMNKFGRHTGSAFAMNTSYSTPRLRHGHNGVNGSSNGIPSEKATWRKVTGPEDLNMNQRIAIRMIRVIKYHVARRKFREAHKPCDFKDIVDENAKGIIKIMHALNDIQRRLDQTLGVSKQNTNHDSDKCGEPVSLNNQVQQLKTKIDDMEKKTNHAISLLEELCQRSNNERINVTMNRIPAVAEEITFGH